METPPCPPRLARWLLRLRLSARQEEVLDDTDWLFELRAAERGLPHARWRYWRDVLNIFLFGIGERAAATSSFSGFAMYRNYLKIALRNLRKHRGYATINIAGLSIGMACCLLLYLYVQHELSFDAFHENKDRLYRVTTQSFEPDGSLASTGTWQPYPLAAALEAAFPEVEATMRLFTVSEFMRHDEEAFEEDILFADPALFQFFSFPLLAGDAATALADPNSVVLSAQTARKYFGAADPLGQSLSVRFDGVFQEVTVTGVAADVPAASSLQFEVVMPFEKLGQAYEWIANRTDNWRASSFNVYVALQAGTDPVALEEKLVAFRAKHRGDEAARLRERGRWEGTHLPHRFHLQPLTDIHLNPAVLGGYQPTSDPQYAFILGAIALAILLIACINFTTLAIARSLERTREVGLRKAVGAQRRQLMVQFWGEAFLMTALALGAGLALAWLLLPAFNQVSARSLSFDLISPEAFGMLATLLVLTGLVAGSYPAVLLSGVQPIDALKSRFRMRGRGLLTKALVVTQFVLCIGLVIGTLVMVQQLSFLQQKNLGYNPDHLVVLPTHSLDGPRLLEHFRNVAAQTQAIQGVTGTGVAFTYGFSREGWRYRGEERAAYYFRIEPDFVDVMEMELVEGRDLDPARPADVRGAALVNESFVHYMGWQNPVGEVLHGFYEEPTVVGVVADVHFQSLSHEVEPMILTLDPGWGLRHLLARLDPTDVAGGLATLERTWHEVAPALPFTYSFLRDDLARQYESEQRWSQIIGQAGLLAVLIACLGLFGLAALTVVRRTKEIGIRKVLGASPQSVLALVSKEFLLLILLAFGVAAPLTYFAANHWLTQFAFHIAMPWQAFFLAGGGILTLTLLTVGFHAWRAARTDPAKSLRYE